MSLLLTSNVRNRGWVWWAVDIQRGVLPIPRAEVSARALGVLGYRNCVSDSVFMKEG